MSSIPFQEAFANGGVQDTTFQNGSGFTFVAIEGYPGAQTQSFWHPFTWTMLPSDPP